MKELPPTVPTGHDPQTARLFEWVLEHADDGYVVLDSAGRVVSANAHARVDLGAAGRANAGGRFWQAVARTHTVVGQPDSDGPVYLIRPETADGLGVWHRVDRLPVPDTFAGRSVVQLRNVTEERRMRQSLWAYRATQKYGMKLKVPKAGAAQAADPGRGVPADEWLRVLQTWVSLAAPTGSQVLVAAPLPARGLVMSMEGFALLAAELFQFVRHPRSSRGPDEGKPATLIVSGGGNAVTITARCPVQTADADDVRRRWLPCYRGQVGGTAPAEPESFTGEAASLVWNLGGQVATRADAAGWVEVLLAIPLQTAGTVEYVPTDNDHSLMGS